MNKKAAIELSMNFIVVIVISIVIMGMGFLLFFKLRDSAVKYKDNVDDQIKQQLKASMLSNNYDVTIWPKEVTINAGSYDYVGIGVNNNLDYRMNFVLKPAGGMTVKYFAKNTDTGDTLTTWNLNNEITMYDPGKLDPKEQATKNILIKVPKNAPSGQYEITFKITALCEVGAAPASPCTAVVDYGAAKVSVIVP